MINFLHKIRFLARCLLIGGVLAGLFFSSGEGIRLLPFPAVAAPHSENVSSGSENSKSHFFLLRNSAVQPGSVGAKIYQNLKFFAGAGDSRTAPRRTQVSRGLTRQDGAGSKFYQNAGLSAAPSNRAPPVI